MVSIKGKVAILLISVGVGFQVSCGNETFTPPAVDCETITYTENIRPIIETRCAIPSCHVPNNPPRLDFTDVEHLQEASNAIRNFWLPVMMPPSGEEPLTQLQIEEIFCWIDAGALDN